MPSYRIYKLDSKSGQRRPGEWLDAADDGEAIELARELSHEARCEVWLQTKLVGIIASESRQNGEGSDAQESESRDGR